MEQKYLTAKTTKSDINEHIETLFKYAKKCETIVECGVRSCVSSWEFLKGLAENNSLKKKLIGVDLEHHPNIKEVFEICKQNNIEYSFIRGNSATANFGETDMLFIDTWHIYAHLKEELKHFPKVKKYIILHDTTVDAEFGESIREKMNIEQQAKDSGYKIEDIRKGLWPAVTEFLNERKDWLLVKRYENNNGLTILARKELYKEKFKFHSHLDSVGHDIRLEGKK